MHRPVCRAARSPCQAANGCRTEVIDRQAEARMRILIIEDNAIFRESLRTLLCAHSDSIEVFEAEDGMDALGLINNCKPDIVFIDIQLPQQTGLQVTRTIKRHFPGIPVAIITSYDFPEYRLAADHCGANYFFCKDTTGAQEIVSLVDYHLANIPDAGP